MSPHSPWYAVLDALADSVNPGLALLALAVPFLRPLRHRPRLAVLYAAVTGIGIIGIYVVAAFDRELRIWERFGGDYSTHTAFATSIVASLVSWKPQWAKQLCGILMAYLVLIMIVGYHSLPDVATSAAVALIATLPGQILVRRRVATRLSDSPAV